MLIQPSQPADSAPEAPAENSQPVPEGPYIFEAYDQTSITSEKRYINAEDLVGEFTVYIVPQGTKNYVEAYQNDILVDMIRLDEIQNGYWKMGMGCLAGDDTWVAGESTLNVGERYDITMNEPGMWLYSIWEKNAGHATRFLFEVQPANPVVAVPTLTLPERFTQPDSLYYIPENALVNFLTPEILQCAMDHIDWMVSIGTKSPWAYARDEYNGSTGAYGPVRSDYISNDWFDFDMSGGYSQDEVDACRECLCTEELIDFALEELESFGRETTLEAAEEYIMDTYGNGVYDGGSTFRGSYERAVAASK